jgi:hypothetical protein
MKQAFALWYRFPNMNDYTNACRSHWSKGAEDKKTWTDTVVWEAKAAKLKPMERAHISFTWIEKNMKRDPDNISAAKKFILDGLQAAGVLPGDGWKCIIGLADEFKKGDRYGVVVVLDDQEV